MAVRKGVPPGSPSTPDTDGTSDSAPALSDATSRLVHQLEQLIERTSQPAMKVSLLQRLARTWEERAGDPARAIEVLTIALAEKPGERKTLSELERVASASGRWKALAHAWTDVLERVSEPAQRGPLLLRLGRLLLEQLDDPAGALGCLEELLVADPGLGAPGLGAPGPDELLRLAADAYRAAERWDALADVLLRQGLLDGDRDRRVALLLEAGQLHEERVQQTEEAIRAFEAALPLTGDDVRVLAPLTRLYRLHDRWSELVDVLDRSARIDPTRQAELRAEAAAICEEQLDDDERAIALYQAIAEAEPGQTEVLERLSDLYLEREDWPALELTFERQLETADSREERAELCLKLALLSEEALEDAPRAAKWYRLLLSHDADHEEAFEALRRIYAAGEQWFELASTLATRAERDIPPERRRDLLLDVAQLRRRRLDDAEGAIQALEAVLERFPDDETALSMLEDLLRAAGDQKRLLRLLDSKAARLDDLTERAVVHLERGEVLREGGRAAEAIEAYRSALADAPQMVTAVRHLSETLAEERRNDEVPSVLREALRHVEDDDVRTELLCDLADAHRLVDDRDGTVDALERALELVPDSARAAGTLADIYISEASWPAALPLLEILLPQIDTEEAPLPSALLLRKIGRVTKELGQEERALSFLRMADTLQPDDTELVADLARLHHRLDQDEAAAERYRQLLQLSGDGADAALVIEARTLLMERAASDGRIAEAKGYADAILALRPDDVRALDVRAVEREQSGDWTKAVELRRRALALREDAEADELELLNRRTVIAELCHDGLHDDAAAIEAYRDAVDHHAGAVGPLLKLLELQHENGLTEDALETLTALLDATDDAQERARFHYAAAQLSTELPEGEQAAIEHYLGAVVNDVERLDALQAAEELLADKEDWDGLTQALERVIAAVQSSGHGHLARNLLRRLGEHHVRRTQDISAAARAYGEACQIDPRDPDLRARYVELLESSGDHTRAVDEMRVLVSMQPDRPERWRALAHIFLQADRPDGEHAALEVLAFLGQATRRERERLLDYHPPRLSEARAMLPREAWERLLRAEGTESGIGEVLGIVYDILRDTLGTRTLKELGLSRGDELEPDQDLLFLRTLANSAQVLGMTPPRVFFDEHSNGFRVLDTHPPAFAIGPSLLKGRRETEIAFIISKGLAFLLPDFAMAALYPARTLRALLRCARAHTHPEDYTPPVDGTERRRMEALLKELSRRLDAPATARLRDAVERAENEELVDWLNAVGQTANRVGLLCAGDVDASARLCVRPLTPQKDPLDQTEAIVDLLMFAISDRFLELRRKLWGLGKMRASD